jgi:UDPglucose 6-dehydrogenase
MAHLGHDVVGYDTDGSKIAILNSGDSPFYEPGFADVLRATIQTGRLSFTDDPGVAIADSEVHFICVGTPQLAGSDAADVRFVDAAVQTIVESATCDGLIVGKSTVPVGTAERLSLELAGSKTPQLDLAWNPEFLREGHAVDDTLNPDRLVFGVGTERAENVLHEVYATLLTGGTPYITTDLATSEMVKVAANSFLATKISFINAMAEICEVAGADVTTLSRALGYDDRIGSKFLRAGLGFGGGCLPKDIRAFSARAGELGAPSALTFLREIDKINMRRRERAVSVASSLLGGDVLGKNVAVLGAAFKPNSDDVRDSPALSVAAALQLKGAAVRVHDPRAIENARRRYPTLHYHDRIESAVANADLVVLATEWEEYVTINPSAFKQLVRSPLILDTRNVVDQQAWINAGWQVFRLGCGQPSA